MAKRFKNLDNILRDWAKGKIPKKSCRSIEQVLEAGRRRTKPFLFLSSSHRSAELSPVTVEPGTVR